MTEYQKLLESMGIDSSNITTRVSVEDYNKIAGGKGANVLTDDFQSTYTQYKIQQAATNGLDYSPGTSGASSGSSAKTSSLFSKILDRLTVKDSNSRSWLNKGLLEDGVDEDDVWKTILASLTDAEEDLWTGAVGIVEGAADAGMMLAPILLGTDKEKATEFVKKDLIDEQGIVRRALASAKGMQDLYAQMETKGYASPEEVDAAMKRIEDQLVYMNDRMEDESVLGEKLDSAVQSGGQLLATAALGQAGVPWWLVSGTTAAGGEAESALNEGATYEEALVSGAISGAAEVLSEKLSGAIKFGGKAMDDALVTALSRKVSNKLARTALKFGLDATGEGLEEVATSLASEFGQWLTYRNEEDWKEVLFSEQAMDEKIEAFLSGALMGGGSNVVNAVTSKAAGVDATTGLTANEEKVVKKLYKDRLAEAEKDGKVSGKQKNKIYDEVVEAMDKGEISVETIEDILGGKAYREYMREMSSTEDKKFLNRYDEVKRNREAKVKENAETKKVHDEHIKMLSTMDDKVDRATAAKSYRDEAVKDFLFKERLEAEAKKLSSENGSEKAVSVDEIPAKRRQQILRKLEDDLIHGRISDEIIDEVTARIEMDLPAYREVPVAEVKTTEVEAPAADVVSESEAQPVDTEWQAMEDRYKEIQDKRNNLRLKARAEVSEMVKSDRLSESYRQKALRGVAFKADLTKVDEKQRAIYQKAMDSGVVNDSRRSHEFVDLVAKIAADKGVDFDFTNNERLKQSGFAVEGATVNGYVNENGVTVNMQSAKALNKVVGHEVTHVLEGTDLYDTLQKVAFDYAEAKGELTGRWEATKALYKDLNSAEINKEITADLVGDYLFDDKDFINRLYSGHRSTFEKIYDEITYLCRVVTAGSKEARQLEKVKKAFADAYLTNTVETARETSHENQQPKSADVLEQNATQSLDNDTVVKEKLKEVDLEIDDQSGTVSFSLSSLEDSFNVSNSDYLLNNTDDTGFVQARKEYVDALAKSIAVDKGKPTEEEVQKAERYMDSLFLIHDLILDDRDRLDYEAAVDKSAWVSNAEYGGSIDFSTLCAKRRLFTGTFDAIQNALPDTVLDENDFLQIRNMLLESDQESPCSMCYVEGSRAKHGVYVQKWLKEYLKTNPEWKPQIADFTSTTRLEQTRIQHPEAYAAYQAAMNKLSQRKPKEASVRTDYKGEILRDFDDATNVEEKNKNGGVRFNSFSDFEVIHALDCMQVLTDMSRVGLNGQAYTKVKEFAECFGNTGLKINLSLVAKDVDANGKLIFDETNGMKYNEAMDLRDRYSDNVGSVIVVFNEAQLKAALADPSIDYVLPFHRSQWKKSQYTMMGLPAQTKDFTNFQNDRIKNPKTGRDVKLAKIKHTSTFTNEQTGETFEIKDNIMPNQYWDFDKSGRENAETYLRYINDNGMTPKFSFLLSKDASGKWVLPDDAVGDGYFKLLIDFKMYNNDGWGSPQNPVVPDFNMGYIQQMLADYKGGHSAFPVANDVVDKFVESKKVKHSLTEDDATKPIAPVYRSGDFTSEDTYFDASSESFAPVAENDKTQPVMAEPVVKSYEADNLTSKDRAKKFFFDEVMSLDKMPESFRKKHGQIWTALQHATENAQDLVVHGAEGVRPLNDIFEAVNQNGLVGEFESYMHHRLNMDTMSLNQRFGLKNKDVFGGVTSEMSRLEAEKLEREHPEFKELSEDIYSYNRYLRNVLVQSGKITQETADLWQKRYPHYVPIKRAGFGDEYEISDILSFMVENMEQAPDADNMDAYFDQVDEAAPVKKRSGSDRPILPLFDTLTERSMQTYWTAAMKGADMKAFAPVRADVQTDRSENNAQTVEGVQKGVPENVKFSAEESSDPKILDVDNEVLRKGQMNPVKWIQEFIADNGMVFERLAKKVKDRGLEAKWNFTRNSWSAAQHLIGKGDAEKGVRALQDMFKEVKKSGNEVKFYEYLAHRRNLDGRTLRLRYGVATNTPVMSSDAKTSSKALFKMDQEYPEFRKWADEVYRYADRLRGMYVEAGLISTHEAEIWRESSPNWIPIEISENGSVSPVFQTLAQATLSVHHNVAMNNFGIHLKNTLGTVVGEETKSLSGIIGGMDTHSGMTRIGHNGRYHTMTVVENGKSVTFEISDEMYEALKPTNDLLATSVPILSQVNNLRRNLITAYNPFFTLKNMVRDVQDVMVNSQHARETYATIPEAIRQIRQKGAYYQEYVRNGGSQNAYFDKKTGDFGGKGILNALETKTGLKYILKANDFVEMTPRLAEYIASREAGASVEVAMLDAARVTTNFAAGGKVTKLLNRNGATFLNASVQGALQQARNFAEAKQNGIKGWASLAARYAALGLPVALLNNLIWDDDEDYQKLPDYITNNYYIVWKYGESSFVRLPKGRTAAVIQNAIKQVSDMPEEKADWREFWKLVGENLAPNNPFEDNLFAPIKQVVRNKTWYDEDLVPNRLQKIEDVTQRFDEKTSRWAVKLSKKIEDSWLGDHVDLSPKQIHYLMDQYSGVLGDTILPFTTPKAEIGSDFILDKAFAPVKDIFTTDSVLNDRVTGDYYDALEDFERRARSEDASMHEALENSIFRGYNYEINQLYQKQRDLQNSDIKDSEKYKQNLEIKKEINALQEKALAELKDIRITGYYAEAGGSRYNFSFDKDDDRYRWYEIRPTNADGSENWYYQMEQGATETFGLSPAEYWNNQEEYSAAYLAAKHFDSPYFETVKNVLGIDDFADYAVGLTSIYADKDKNGNSISGTRKRKMKDYIYGLNIPEIEKHILFKAEYNYTRQHDHEIRKYLDGLDLSSSELSDVLKELGMK